MVILTLVFSSGRGKSWIEDRHLNSKQTGDNPRTYRWSARTTRILDVPWRSRQKSRRTLPRLHERYYFGFLLLELLSIMFEPGWAVPSSNASGTRASSSSASTLSGVHLDPMMRTLSGPATPKRFWWPTGPPPTTSSPSGPATAAIRCLERNALLFASAQHWQRKRYYIFLWNFRILEKNI